MTDDDGGGYRIDRVVAVDGQIRELAHSAAAQGLEHEFFRTLKSILSELGKMAQRLCVAKNGSTGRARFWATSKLPEHYAVPIAERPDYNIDPFRSLSASGLIRASSFSTLIRASSFSSGPEKRRRILTTPADEKP